MIPASLLEHAPPAVATDLPNVADIPPVPMLLWPRGYSEGPCAAELGTIRVHRDGRCCHCLGLVLAEAQHAGDGE